MTTRAIEFTTASCSLGRILLAATERGVCRVAFGDREAEDDLEAMLLSELPYAVVRRNDVRLKRWRDRLVDYVDGRSARLELPVDVRGSQFQRRVWEALQRIPRGDTRSYGELASALDVPGGARAVARACAANPVAVVIPCHRIVPARGGIGGYRWGEERKRVLLERERPPARRSALSGLA